MMRPKKIPRRRPGRIPASRLDHFQAHDGLLIPAQPDFPGRPPWGPDAQTFYHQQIPLGCLPAGFKRVLEALDGSVALYPGRLFEIQQLFEGVERAPRDGEALL